MDAIKINNLTKKYDDIVAVNALNLEIKQGELFSLLGVNGAGKTTIIKMLTCLIRPTSGDALILDNSINTDLDKIKKIINVSPQETAIALNLSVRENLTFIAGIYELNDIAKKVNNILNQFALESVKNKIARKLSGGYQRRLSIAMALITEPKVLFLDEPTLGLDVLARRELWQIIEKLKGKTTLILTTHYMEEAEKLSDRIGIIANGQLIEVGTSKELIKKAHAKNFEDAFVNLASEGQK